MELSIFNSQLSIKNRTFALAFQKQSGCSAVGSALRSGRRGRAFESPHPDFEKLKLISFREVWEYTPHTSFCF